MINNFLIINCIGKDDKLGLRINKDFFIHNFNNKKIIVKNIVLRYLDFIKKRTVN